MQRIHSINSTVGWLEVWNKYDPYGVYKNLILSGYRVVPPEAAQAVMYDAVISTDEARLSKEDKDFADMIKVLKYRNAFSCFLSQLPYSYHTDNVCHISGLYTQEMKNGPKNFHLAVGSLNSHNSELEANNTNVVGAKFEFPVQNSMLVAPHKGDILFHETNQKEAEDISIILIIIVIFTVISAITCASVAGYLDRYNKERILMGTTKFV